MKIRHMLGLMALLCTFACGTSEDFNPSDYVNPNIGTVHSRWFFYTPAARPFGMAKLGASTNGTYGNEQGWEAVGYEDGHTSIDGFPCLHEFQVGGVSLMPVTGELKTIPGLMENPDEGFRSRFDKADEHARPGYYTVVLKDYGVKAELTATDRVGFQRYTFPESDQSRIIFNIGNRQGESGPIVDSYIKMIDPQTVEGYVISEPTYVQKYQAGATVPMYFYAVLDTPAESANVFHQGGTVSEADQINGAGAMMALNFKTKAGDKINVKVGLSYTSIDNAKLNLETEASDLTFDEALADAEEIWEESLSRVKVYGGSEDSKIKFYTGLYHAILGRGLASDINGAYPKNDGTTGVIPAGENGQPVHHFYNTDAIWGAYWNLTQLWTLAYPEYYNDWVCSQLLVYKDAGWLGDGIANSKYVSGVGTNMTSIAIAAAYNNGIRNYDIDLAYEASLKNEIGWEGRIEGAGKMDTKQWVERGYIPYDDSIFFGTHPEGSQFCVSHTVEYSFSSAAVAQFAKSLGHDEDHAKLVELSKGWEKCFDEDLKLLRPRMKDGSFIDNFNPLESWRGFQEGNAMQYTFFVPHTPGRLVEKVGEKEFNHRLDSIFTVARESIFGGGKTVHAFAGLQSPYNHGNQPNLHISWLFNLSGKPWLTQKWTRLICDEFYGTEAEHGYGYGQDEDQGQLGAWYVMAAMGLFDVKGGTSENPDMQIGSPQFDRIEIALSPVNATGEKFVIETKGNGADTYYVQSATLNGKPYQSCHIPNSEIFKGGKLVLEMGTEPNENWGK
jgi:predicted alpha-1,2-mannosidase